MCEWMRPWLLPAGLLGTVVLISLPSPFALILVGIWGWLVFPYVAAYIHSHSHADGGRYNENGSTDGEADYWRTKLR
jgi:Mn2+/Fe2+ NRAMP family transporter